MTSRDLPTALVSALERLRSASPSAVRQAAYDVLASAGVDVDRLVRDELETMRGEYEDHVERRAALRLHLRHRLQSGSLEPSKVPDAEQRLAKLDLRIKADKQAAARVLRRLEARLPIAPASAPTAERQRHLDEPPLQADRDENDVPLGAPRFRIVWPIDRMGNMLTDAEYSAAVRTRDVYEARRARSRVADLSGGGVGVPGPRLPVTVRQVRAGAEWSALGQRVPVAVRGIVLNFVCGEAPAGRDEPWSLVEFGRLYGGINEEKTARGVAYGAIKTACALLDLAWQQYDARRVDERIEAGHRARQPR